MGLSNQSALGSCGIQSLFKALSQFRVGVALDNQAAASQQGSQAFRRNAFDLGQAILDTGSHTIIPGIELQCNRVKIVIHQ